mmetsp:Transcript_16632/g.25031  ORF Transcript_16632/g.25031 Transcript_16632/m.25031 type:complete len:230 (+) Transcript_16632:224-913(+)|eukprot:CAMPEP_0185024856 /NCGR_PEP_ID=MMETSP1103-20130426/8040_1 /TAXON_ID=36769 /ORGANISM="Paraphysomonas bandaiensis, Strain Caron Lab Isolate" /LENGTH=229 /DNA_ID=CAMNT_0027557927 /DNA_START=197 /DNA_END=886 /DNA_ORIENTATION=+
MPHWDRVVPDVRSGGSSLPPVASSSAIRKKVWSDEYQAIRRSFEDNYKKYRTAKRTKSYDALSLGYQELDMWLKKHKVNITVRLTKKEFSTFWNWFTSRLDDFQCEDGIKIDRVIDDFVKNGVFKSRADSAFFLHRIDSDRNGSISFEEFMTGLTCGTDSQQIMLLRKFITSLQADKKKIDRRKAKRKKYVPMQSTEEGSEIVNVSTTSNAPIKLPVIHKAPSSEKRNN